MDIQWLNVLQLVTSLGDSEGVAFLHIEIYLPSLGLVLEGGEVSLELSVVLDLYLLFTADFSVQEAVNNKQTCESGWCGGDTWYHCSDNQLKKTNLNQEINDAYILFYKF